MAFDRPKGDLPAKSTRSLRCGISVACVALIASVFGASFASATPPEEAAHAVESVAATHVPSVPSAAPPVTPPASAPAPAPVEAAAAPQVPANNHVSTGATSKSHVVPTSPPKATKVRSPGPAFPSPREATSSARESAGMVAVTSTEARTQRAAAPARHDADADVGSASLRGPGSIKPAEAAPLPHWLAYVWPAIALGRSGALAALLTRWESATSLPALPSLPAPGAVRLFSQVLGITGGSDASTPSKQSAAPIGSLAPRPAAPVPSTGGMSLFLTVITSLLALVGLITLVRLTVGEEPFSSMRWPH